jgi:rRNA maturation endonuclease Nob1
MHYVHRVRHALANGSGEMQGFDAAGAGALESAAAAAAEWAGERGSEATAGELAAKLAELQASCEPVFERAAEHLRLVAALQEYAQRIRHALSDHAREPQLSAADASALKEAAAGAEAWLGERAGKAADSELAAKLAELQATCNPVFEQATEWLKCAVLLKQYMQRVSRALSDHAREPQLSAADASALKEVAAGAEAWLGERAGEAADSELATKLAELEASCDPVFENQRVVGLIHQYAERIRRALSDHARWPRLSATDASALKEAAAGAEAWLGERAGEAAGGELAAKLAELQASCRQAAVFKVSCYQK